MSKKLDLIDTILAKPRQEWSDEEFELIIDWRVECRMNQEEYEMQVAAMQEQLIESAEASYERGLVAQAALEDMKTRAFELLERASYNAS